MPAVAGHITRTALTLADLAICNTTYDVMYDDANGLDVGTVSWRRLTAESPFVAGRVLTQAVKDTPVMSLRVDVTGANLGTVQNNINTLVTALWQPTYQLSLSLDSGVTYTWTCEPADATVGFTYGHVLGLVCPVVLSIPRDPNPVAGPI